MKISIPQNSLSVRYLLKECLEGQNILLIEDEKNVADLIIQGLEEDGFTTFHALNYDQAIERLRSFKIDLVILDVLLPRMNGLDICKNLRSLRYTPKTSRSCLKYVKPNLDILMIIHVCSCII